MDPIAIINYGAGNVRSVQKAFHRLGHKTILSSDPYTVARAPAVIFPGQGASRPAMNALNANGLADAIRKAIADNKPFFGVCLGLQLLVDWSEEGDTECLGILPGTTKRLPPELKVPHMGWNNVSLNFSHPVFQDVPEGSQFYFVHSYHANFEHGEFVLGTTSYGIQFCSVAARDNLIATQFHPEKSGSLGLRLYDNFVRRFVYGGSSAKR